MAPAGAANTSAARIAMPASMMPRRIRTSSRRIFQEPGRHRGRPVPTKEAQPDELALQAASPMTLGWRVASCNRCCLDNGLLIAGGRPRGRMRMHLRRASLVLMTAAVLCVSGLVSVATASPAGVTAATPAELTTICEDLFAGVYETPSSEPLAVCQWDMALIDANASAWSRATGAGVTIGILDSGVDPTHPDIAPNLDLARSCSFISPGTPTADPVEVATSCANKAAIRDLYGHGTHVASVAAAPINGIGIAGVAPEATLVALKACTVGGFCFVNSVAAALRYAGDQRLDVVNMSLFADPFLYYCRNEAEQRAMLKQLQSAARYAQQRGV